MNHLKNAKSRYLLQHANNPVDWYDWGEEPFAIAQKENKPVLVSIGYAACHWCHVMAEESFEDETVAAFMNQHFVCIKVDREENPDVDHFYMDALQSLSGSGGWPLNMFVTPDKKPFYGGTYFPPEPRYGRTSWLELLKIIAKAWQEKPNEIAQQSSEMLQHLKDVSDAGTGLTGIPGLNKDLVDGICRNLLVNADTEWGGFGEAPKFPASFSLQFLLDYYQLQKNRDQVTELGQKALNQATLTLDRMLEGGIYDQIGGGFFRYATDAQWQIPHYEKMLYDNALMISVLSVAFRITQKQRYLKALEETVRFCNRELKAPDGPGFYCSLDADTNGVEGGHYMWTKTDWNRALKAPHPAVTAYFGMEDESDESPEHPLIGIFSEEDICKKYQLAGQEWSMLLNTAKAKLLAYRRQRNQPGTDDKMLLSWNALMNKALQDAAMVLNDDQLMAQAIAHLQWMQKAFRVDDKEIAMHVVKDGKAYVNIKLDDYAFLIRAMISLASNNGLNNLLEAAYRYMLDVIELFWSEEKGYFYYSSSLQNDIPVRKVEMYDGAQPSANSIMAECLSLLGECYEKEALILMSERMLKGVSETVRRFARSFSYWGLLIQRKVADQKLIVLAGASVNKNLQILNRNYFPEATILICKKDDETVPILENKFQNSDLCLYLCYNRRCLAPVNSVEALKKSIKKAE